MGLEVLLELLAMEAEQESALASAEGFLLKVLYLSACLLFPGILGRKRGSFVGFRDV